MSEEKFPCTGCGACCRRISMIVASFGGISPDSKLFFPYKADATGKCEKLGDDNKCTVYETRPLVCNVERLREFVGMPRKEYYDLNIKLCNSFMDADNLPQHFRINQ